MADSTPDRTNQVSPDPTRKIQWAQASALDQKVDAFRSRNWITEELIQFSQKHWHCTREEAVTRLTAEPAKA